MSVRQRETGDLDFGECIDLESKGDKSEQVIHVVLDGVANDMETLESFAIKFGLLTSMPVTKVRHLTRKLPSSIWTGRSPSKAKGLLSLVEEAGGSGRLVVEEVRRPEAQSQAAGACRERSCSACGFPLKGDEQFCQFCLTPVSGEKRKISRAPRLDGRSAVPPARMLFYVLVIFAAVVITLVLRS